MEPMMLGSPVGSPGSPGTNQYLPPFLLGEQSTPRAFTSSTPVQRRISTEINVGLIPGQSAAAPRSPTDRRESCLRSVNLHHPSEKTGGPPTQGLFESLTDVKSSPRNNLNSSLTASAIATPTAAFGMSDSYFQPRTPMNTTAVSWGSPMYPQQNPTDTMQNSFHPSMNASSFVRSTPSESEIPDSCWVTVFGFPPAANTYIISQFSLFGTIVEYRISDAGNWIHLRYQTPLEARTALSKNGKVFGKYIMVGVNPCREEDIARLQSQKENLPATPGFTNSPSSYLQRSSIGFGYNHDNTRHLGEIQPLNFQNRHQSTSVLPIAGTPRKSSSVVSKAMDLLFGW